MSSRELEQQHQQLLREVRDGTLTAREARKLYTPYKASEGCWDHMFINDRDCPGCRRRMRETEEDRMVDSFVRELEREEYRHQRDRERDRDRALRTAKERAARKRAVAANDPDDDSLPWRQYGIILAGAIVFGIGYGIYQFALWVWGGITGIF